MTPTLLLRIASGCYAILTLGHTVGMTYPSRGPEEDAVFAAMRGYTFDMFGTPRTHWEFYRGEGWYVSVFAFLFTAVAWQVGTVARRDPAGARWLVASLLVASAASAVLNWGWFFLMPATTSTVGTVALLGALVGGLRAGAGRGVASAA